ncbi:hypothetical protein NAPIS_ORF01555, partial [Vairimorpha apis BRL 01]
TDTISVGRKGLKQVNFNLYGIIFYDMCCEIIVTWLLITILELVLYLPTHGSIGTITRRSISLVAASEQETTLDCNPYGAVNHIFYFLFRRGCISCSLNIGRMRYLSTAKELVKMYYNYSEITIPETHNSLLEDHNHSDTNRTDSSHFLGHRCRTLDEPYETLNILNNSRAVKRVTTYLPNVLLYKMEEDYYFYEMFLYSIQVAKQMSRSWRQLGFSITIEVNRSDLIMTVYFLHKKNELLNPYLYRISMLELLLCKESDCLLKHSFLYLQEVNSAHNYDSLKQRDSYWNGLVINQRGKKTLLSLTLVCPNEYSMYCSEVEESVKPLVYLNICLQWIYGDNTAGNLGLAIPITFIMYWVFENRQAIIATLLFDSSMSSLLIIEREMGLDLYLMMTTGGAINYSVMLLSYVISIKAESLLSLKRVYRHLEIERIHIQAPSIIRAFYNLWCESYNRAGNALGMGDPLPDERVLRLYHSAELSCVLKWCIEPSDFVPILLTEFAILMLCFSLGSFWWSGDFSSSAKLIDVLRSRRTLNSSVAASIADKYGILDLTYTRLRCNLVKWSTRMAASNRIPILYKNRCYLCDGPLENLEHCLIECPLLTEIRNQYAEKLRILQCTITSNQDKVKFILGNKKRLKHNPEKIDELCTCIEFVDKMIVNRAILIQNKLTIFTEKISEMEENNEALSPAELSCVLNWCIEPGKEVLSARTGIVCWRASAILMFCFSLGSFWWFGDFSSGAEILFFINKFLFYFILQLIIIFLI